MEMTGTGSGGDHCQRLCNAIENETTVEREPQRVRQRQRETQTEMSLTCVGV